MVGRVAQREHAVTADTLPDFIVIGAMKSATSSLYWWLREQPECFLASPKEIDFFSKQDRWRRGIKWYARLFDDAPSGRLLGEASVSYTLPRFADLAASRMSWMLPGVRLIAILRHPEERLRSHYRHEVQRGRERRSFIDAVSAPENPYVATSRYFSCLEPYLNRFPRDQVCLVRFEDLVSGSQPGWDQIIRFLQLPPRPSPTTAHNVSNQHRQWSPAMRLLHGLGVFRLGAVVRLPSPIRRVGRRILLHDGADYRMTLEASRFEAVPADVSDQLWSDIARLDAWLGTTTPLWSSHSIAEAR
jgi:hypothetical protein